MQRLAGSWLLCSVMRPGEEMEAIVKTRPFTVREALERLVAAAVGMGFFQERGRLTKAHFAAVADAADLAQVALQLDDSRKVCSIDGIEDLLARKAADEELLRDVVEQWESADGSHYLVPTEVIDRIRARLRGADDA